MDSDLQEVPMPNTAPPQVGQSGRAGEFVHVGDLKKLEGLEKALEGACATLTTFAENVMDFTFDAQHMLYGKVNEFVRDLQELEKCSKGVEAMIPIEVLEAIDKGRNPELVTYSLLEQCAEANNASRGKLTVMRQFRDELEKAVKDVDEELKSAKEDGTTGGAGGVEGGGVVPGNAENGFEVGGMQVG